MDRDEILGEIRRTAKDNGGKPLGRGRFVRVTGITEYEIGRHWARFGDAQREAGFEPNTLQAAHDDDFLMEKLVELIRKLGHIPTLAEMRLERGTHDPSFPSPHVYEKFGPKNERIGKALAWCRAHPQHEDVASILESAYSRPAPSDEGGGSGAESAGYGFVYLVRGHPGEYKIGRTNLVDRRLSELGVTSPVEQTLVHEIKTDDPVNIEAYWHNRFAGKRMRGEWFKLTSADVKAFKRWKRIF